MSLLKARVRNGRLVMDEPTDLPEGTVVELVPLEDEDWDDLDEEERARLHEALDRAHENAKAGNVVPAEEVLARLRSRR